jgi:hypothetical protein
MIMAWRTPFLLAAALVTPFTACSDFLADAATAIAYDIESHTGRFAASKAAAATTLVHVPKPNRGGCADGYRVQFSRASSLVVWCWAPGSTTQSVSSHTTTYHLRFVDVRETIIVDKQRGESLSIEIVSAPGKPLVRTVW